MRQMVINTLYIVTCTCMYCKDFCNHINILVKDYSIVNMYVVGMYMYMCTCVLVCALHLKG